MGGCQRNRGANSTECACEAQEANKLPWGFLELCKVALICVLNIRIRLHLNAKSQKKCWRIDRFSKQEQTDLWLIDEGIIQPLMRGLTKYLQNLPTSRNTSLKQHFRSVLASYLKAKKQWYRKEENKRWCESVWTSSDYATQTALPTMVTVLMDYPDEGGFNLSSEKQTFLWHHRLKDLFSDKKSCCLIQGLPGKKTYLRESIARQIVKKNGELNYDWTLSPKKSGRFMVVFEHDNQRYFLKFSKDSLPLCSRESAVGILHRLLGGRYVAQGLPVRLIITGKKRPVVEWAWLSEGIAGNTLSQAMDNTPDDLDKLDAQNYFELFALDFLTSPEDNNPDGLILRRKLNKKTGRSSFEFISIDNGHAFIHPFSSRGGRLYLKTMLYYLKDIRKPIPERFQDKFALLNEEKIIQALRERFDILNEPYRALLKNNLFALCKKEKRQCQQMLILSEPIEQTLMFRLLRFLETLRQPSDDKKQPSALDLLHDLDEGVMLKHVSLIGKLEQSYDYYQQYLNAYARDSQTGKFYSTTQPKQIIRYTLTPEKLCQSMRLDEAYFHRIQWSELAGSKKCQRLLLELMQYVAFTRLTLSGSDEVTDDLFKKTIRNSNKLTEVNLSSCPKLTIQSLRYLLSNRPGIKQLRNISMDNNHQLVNVTVTSNWAHLEYLSLLKCPNIENVNLNYPPKYLYIDQHKPGVKIKNVKIYAETLLNHSYSLVNHEAGKDLKATNLGEILYEEKRYIEMLFLFSRSAKFFIHRPTLFISDGDAFKKIVLSDNNLTEATVKSILDCLSKDQRLLGIDFRFKSVYGDPEKIREQHEFIEERREKIQVILRSRRHFCSYIQSIYKPSQPINTVEAAYQQIEKNKSGAVTSLDFSKLELGNEIIIRLMQSLEKNTFVTEIDLSGNELTQTVLQSILDCLSKNQTLQKINLDCAWESGFIGKNTKKIQAILRSRRHFCSYIQGIYKPSQPINTVEAAYQQIEKDKSGAVTSLDFSKLELGNEIIIRLMQALTKNTVVTTIDLSENRLTDSVAQPILDCLSKNQTLQRINLGRGSNINEESTKRIEAALRLNRFCAPIQKAYKSSQRINTLKAACQQIEKDKSGAVTSLDFSKLELGNELIIRLMQALTKNTVVKTIDLSENRLTDSVAQPILDCLSKNQTLQKINLGGGDNINKENIKRIEGVLRLRRRFCASIQSLYKLSQPINTLKAACQQIEKDKSRTVTQLDLKRLDLGDELIIHLMQALTKNTVVTKIVLSDNGLTQAVVEPILNCLSKNQTLRKIKFGCESNINGESIKRIEDILRPRRFCFSIQETCWPRQPIKTVEAACQLIEENKVATLNFSYRALGDELIIRLMQSLKKNTVATRIYLSDNGLTQAVVEPILDCLSKNRSLLRIDLEFWNNINKESIKRIEVALRLNRFCDPIQKAYKPSQPINTIKAACQLIEKDKNRTVTQLDFSGLDLGDELIIRLMQPLKKNTVVTKIILSDNGLTQAVIEPILNCLSENQSLLRIVLFSSFRFYRFDDYYDSRITRENRKKIEVILRPRRFCASIQNIYKPNSPIHTLKVAYEQIAKDKRKTITCLDFSGLKLGDEIIAGLMQALEKNTVVTEIDLSRNRLTKKVVQPIVDCLSKNQRLMRINFGSWAKLNKESIEKIENILSPRRNFCDYIQNIYKPSQPTNALNKAYQQIEKDKRGAVTYLNFSGFGLGDEMMTHLMQAFEKNTFVTAIDLSHNRLTDAVIEPILACLSENQSLLRMVFCSNFRLYRFDDCYDNRITRVNRKKIEVILRPRRFCASIQNIYKPNSPIHTLKVAYEQIAKDKRETITCLDFSGLELGDEIIAGLMQTLEKNTVVTEIDLSRNRLTRKVVQPIVDCLSKNQRLIRINFGSWGRLNEESIKKIENILSLRRRFCVYIQKTYKPSQPINALNKAYQQIEKDKRGTVTYLDFSAFGLGDEMITHLMQTFEKNTFVTAIDLSHNRLTEAVVQPTLDCLAKNQSLQRIDFYSDSITDLYDVGGYKNEIVRVSIKKIEVILRLRRFSASIQNIYKPSSPIHTLKVAYEQIAKDKRKTITCLDFSGLKLGDEIIAGLMQALEKNTVVTTIALSCNKLTKKVVQPIVDCLSKNQNLLRIDFYSDSMADLYDIGNGKNKIIRASREKIEVILRPRRFCDSIQNIYKPNSPIHTLKVAYEQIAKDKRETITCLDFSGLELGDEIITDLMQTLEKNTVVTTIDLSDNRLTQAIIAPIQSLLKRNNTLQTIDLFGNEALGMKDRESVQSAMKSRKTQDKKVLHGDNLSTIFKKNINRPKAPYSGESASESTKKRGVFRQIF
jgi:Ran GTPase-activating protein (RanGAP) involved in mRNA processing and transport